MENESFPLSEELIVLCHNREALRNNDDALNALTTLKKANDYPSFEWCLKNLHNFQTNEGRVFAIQNIYDFVSSSWHQIPESIYPLFIEELFTKIWQDPNFQDKSYHITIFKTQNLAIYGLYPKYWPNFFDFLLDSPKPILYGFLSSFNYSVYDRASTSRRNIVGLLNSCLKDGSQVKILQVVINDVLNRVENASKSLISTVEWVDLSLLLNSDLISLFIQLLSQSDTCKTGLNIFISIFHRPLAQDFLYELVNGLQLTNIIHQIVAGSEGDKEIIILCSQLLFTAYSKLVSSQLSSLFELISNVAELSMNLFMFPIEKSTTFNYRLLMSIFTYYPLFSTRYFPMLITKISSSIALNSEDADSITQTSLKLFFNSANTSGIDVIPHLISLSSGLNPNENIVETATLLAALKMVFFTQNEKENNLTASFAQMFSPLLSVQPPFLPAHFVAMSNYLQLIQPMLHEFDPNFRAQFFIKCIELVMTKECINSAKSDRNNLLEGIYEVCKANPELISAIPNVKEMLPSFVQTGEISLIKSASLIVSTLTAEERFQFYSQILQFFAVYLNFSTVNQTEKVPESSNYYDQFIISYDSRTLSVLHFWILAKCDDLIQLKPALIEFFTIFYNEKNDIVNTEELFHYFCEASVKALGTDAFPIFWNTSNYMNDFECATIIIRASFDLLKNPPFDEKVSLIFQLMNNVFGLKNHSSRIMMMSDEVIQKNDFYETSAKFLLMIIPNLQQNSNELPLSISRLMDLILSMKLPNLMMNNIILFFLANPGLINGQIASIFQFFMIVLDEFRRIGSNEQRELLLNSMKLLHILASTENSFDWKSPLWRNIEDFHVNGPDVMKEIMLSSDEQFEKMALSFLEKVEPQKVYFEDEFVADSESNYED